MKPKNLKIIGFILLILSICILHYGKIDSKNIEDIMPLLGLSTLATIGFVSIMCPFDTDKEGKITFNPDKFY